MFLTTLRDAGKSFPIKQVFRDVRDAGRALGWSTASYPTFYRRWMDLPAAQRPAIRKGRVEAVTQLRQPALRDRTTLKAMDILSLDRRTKDFWADWGNGKPVRSTFLPLVDVASGMVLHWVLARSENAADTVRLIVETVEKFGIPSGIYTDNGSAFAGHLVAGGSVRPFRTSGSKTVGVQPLGVCHHLGVNLRFALPANGQAKLAERSFADLSRCINDRPEFGNAHAGHGPGAAPDSHVIPVPVDYARQIIGREIDRYDREPGRRSQTARGRSYEETFRDLNAERMPTKATERQLHLASLIYTPGAVDRDGWTYGGTDTQDALLRYHGKKNGEKQRILLGRNPTNSGNPALARNESGDLVGEGIEAVERTAYHSTEGARDAARNARHARKEVAAGLAAENFLAEEEMRAAWAALTPPDSVLDAQDQTVIGARFGAPVARQAREPLNEV